MGLTRRNVQGVLGSLPFLGWLDPIRATVNHSVARHYREHKDGRSLYTLLNEHIHSGIRVDDLERILGIGRSLGQIDAHYTNQVQSDPDAYPDGVEPHDEMFEYPMSYWFVHLHIRDGVLINHDPTWYAEYPTGLVVHDDGTIEARTT